MPGHAPDHPLRFLVIRALGLPPPKGPKSPEHPDGDKRELLRYQSERPDFLLMLAGVRRDFDRLAPEAQRFVAEYLKGGLADAAQAVRDAKILTVRDPTDRVQWTTLDYEQRANQIQRDVYVRAVLLFCEKLGRYDQPDKTHLRALALADVYRARSVHDRIEAMKNVIRLFGKEIAVFEEGDDGDDLVRRAEALEAAARARAAPGAKNGEATRHGDA